MDKKIISALLCVLAVSAYLIISGMKESISFYITPTELTREIQKYQGKRLRIGGFVSELKVNGLDHLFILTDENGYSVQVTFRGIPPDLFGKARGAIVEGFWDNKMKIFVAESIMAKHSEEYMPPGAQKIHKK